MNGSGWLKEGVGGWLSCLATQGGWPKCCQPLYSTRARGPLTACYFLAGMDNTQYVLIQNTIQYVLYAIREGPRIACYPKRVTAYYTLYVYEKVTVLRFSKSIQYIDAILRGELFWSIYCQYLERKQSILIALAMHASPAMPNRT